MSQPSQWPQRCSSSAVLLVSAVEVEIDHVLGIDEARPLGHKKLCDNALKIVHSCSVFMMPNAESKPPAVGGSA